MGCQHAKLVIPNNCNRVVSDMASKIAIDLMTIYCDKTELPYDIFIDNSHYLFGKRVIADSGSKPRDCRLQYPVPSQLSMDLLDIGCDNPVTLLKEYLALHVSSYPVNITYNIQSAKLNILSAASMITNGGQTIEYFEIELDDLDKIKAIHYR